MTEHDAASQPPLTTRTTCPYCGVGCGVLASIDERGAVDVRGDPDHPANRGRLCSKGTALGETVALTERLLYPQVGDQQVAWETALDTVAGRFLQTIQKHGPGSVAFYVSGQLLTEDYYVANKLMKGFLGSANIDTNSRLCMSSAVAGYKRAFGEDVVPCCYDDIDRARLIVLVGSNAAWCHPVLYQRIARARKKYADLKIVLIDPRITQTAGIADLHLAIAPGCDGLLFNALLVYLADAGECNELFTGQCTEGMDEALASARTSAPDPAVVAEACGLTLEKLQEFFSLFARNERVLTLFSQGINQSSSGVDKVNAIINCHLFTGRIGRPGMGPFSLTGQPNAMGGREVGGLSNQLAAHMDLGDPEARERVQRFWQSPVIAGQDGLKAVDLFEAVATGRIKALWIMATNPVVSLPEADRVRAALKSCEFLVVSDCVAETDTARLAHVRLPATTWGERDGTVTNSERLISRQRQFLQPPGLARPDWWIVCEVARRLGHSQAFIFPDAAAIFREHAALSAFENDGRRQFDLGALSNIETESYNALQPMRWPINAGSPQGSERLFRDGRFSTPSGRARFVPVTPRPPASLPTAEFPFVLNTGRVRDHWHTMTRTGMSPRLSAHIIEPFVEIHPDDAVVHGIADEQLAVVASPTGGEVYLRVNITDKQRRGSLFVPMHWNDQFASNARVGALVKATVDPISGQPESKHGIAAIRPCLANWYGFLISRNRPQLRYARYWTRSRGRGLWRYELAGETMPEDWSQHFRGLIDAPENGGDWIEFYDKTSAHYRSAYLRDGQLQACLFVSRERLLPPRDWLIDLFQQESLSRAERAALLTGKPPSDAADAGRTVCACFNVGEKAIAKFIRQHGNTSVEEIGDTLSAGTNCGSCRPELAEIIGEYSSG